MDEFPIPNKLDLQAKKEQPLSVEQLKAHYREILENSYESGESIHLPELDFFGKENVEYDKIEAFLLELVDFIIEKENGASDEDLYSLANFANDIRGNYFSASPCLVNLISLQEKLCLVARATRSTVIKSTFGSTLVGETSYEIGWMQGDLFQVIEKLFPTLSVPEQLDVLHQLRAVAANAIGSSPAYSNADEKILEAYKRIAESKEYSVLLKLAAEEGIDSVQAEYEDPQIGFVRFSGQVNDSRLDTRDTQDRYLNNFFFQYRLDAGLPSQARAMRASRDSVIFVDRTGLAFGTVKIDDDFAVEKKDQNINTNLFLLFKKRLENIDGLDKGNKFKIIEIIFEEIFNQEIDPLIESGDFKKASLIMAEIFPDIEVDWENNLNVMTALRKSGQRQRSALRSLGIDVLKVFDKLTNGVTNYVEEKAKQLESLPKLHFESFGNTMQDIGGSRYTPDDVLLFQHIHSSGLAGRIEDFFGFKLSDITVEEQYYFLNYLKDVTAENTEKITRFIELNGVVGLRTFLALGRGDKSLGDLIVDFGQRGEASKKVFAYYSELLDSANNAENLAMQSVGGTRVSNLLIGQVRENILSRAQSDLERAVRIKDDTEISLVLKDYVARAKEHVAILQEIGAGNIEMTSAENLKENDKEAMRALLIKNYEAGYPGDNFLDFRNTILASLEKSLSTDGTAFRILRDGEKIICFCRFGNFVTNGKSITYFGSFNAESAYSGAGGVMLEEVIKDELKNGKEMVAHCDPSKPITIKYIESGFVARDFISVAGVPSFEIFRTVKMDEQLKSKSLTYEQLLSPNVDSRQFIVREKNDTESYPELSQGKILTRYFSHNDKKYLVFEDAQNINR